MTRTFGKSFGKVVEHVDCPRCGSPAVIRIRMKDLTDIYEEHLTCPKCHNVLFVGFMTIGARKLDERLQRLERLKEKLTIPKDLKRLEAKIEELKERMAIHELTRADGFAVRVTPGEDEKGVL